MAGIIEETRSEMEVEWKISNFFSHTDIFASRPFHFCGMPVQFAFDPGLDDGWTAVYVDYFGAVKPSPWTISCSLLRGNGIRERTVSLPFKKKHLWWGVRQFVLRSELEQRKLELVPSDVLTIAFTIKHSNRNDVTVSSVGMLKDASDCWTKILEEKKQTDVVLKVGEREFPAHRAVLACRSPVFSAMFSHDTEESRTGVVNIQDIDPDAFQIVLSYVYSGIVDRIPFHSVFDVYLAADKYYFHDLKELCRTVMKGNLSPRKVCGVIKFADFHSEEELAIRARNYFQENVKAVLETDNWKEFASENPALSVDLLSSVIQNMY